MQIPLLLGILSFGTAYFDPPRKSSKKTPLHPLLQHLDKPTDFLPRNFNGGYNQSSIKARIKAKP